MFQNLDPSKMDPKLLAEISALIQSLPPEKLSQMQTLMHNTMAGFDTQKEVAAFEASLPPSFREKMANIMYRHHGALPNETPVTKEISNSQTDTLTELKDKKSARLTILQAVAQGKLSPEEAEQTLFGND